MLHGVAINLFYKNFFVHDALNNIYIKIFHKMIFWMVKGLRKKIFTNATQIFGEGCPEIFHQRGHVTNFFDKRYKVFNKQT